MTVARRPGLVSSLVASGFLLACSTSTDNRVSRAAYGAGWPFTIDEGTLNCQRESSRSDRLLVTLDNGKGVMYALNGSARDFGFPDHTSILKSGMTGADVQPFIDMGLALCR
jgi:hypothetical protein